MDDAAETLITNTLGKNIANYESYPATTDIQRRCVNMIADLFHVPRDERSQADAVGTSTVGSSEAILLAVLAMKKRWASRRGAESKDTSRPHLIMSSAVHVCWKKAACYFDIEVRYVYCTTDRFAIDPSAAVSLVDENTIGICSIMGTTYTGEYEDTKRINDLLVERNLDVPIHIDAASGGFVAPFVNPDLVWDFRLEKVVSINVSGHKYGLVYAGVGWVVWRAPEYLPEGKLTYRREIALCLRSVSRLPCLILLNRAHPQHELPGHRASDIHHELLPQRIPRHRSILQTHQPG